MAFGYDTPKEAQEDYDTAAIIVVDDARAQRREAAAALSRRLGVRLQHVVRSKRKTSAQSTRYGEANAINTGIFSAATAAPGPMPVSSLPSSRS